MVATRQIGGIVAVGLSIALITGCSGNGGETTGGDADTLEIAAFAGGYGAEMYEKVVAAYEEANPDVDIELNATRTLVDELTPQVAAGDYPDLVVLGLGGPEGFTESFVRDESLEELTDVLDMTIPGEDVTVGDKLTDGIVGNLSTNPYGDDRVFLMPVNASPTGLVYNQGIFEQKGWEVPTTWDEMLALGETAKAEGIALFTYPTAGYLDSYFFSLAAAVGGEDFYRSVVTYEEDVWNTPEAEQVFELTAALLDYAAPTTVGFANNQDFTKNQQSILDDTALFMPNGGWIAGEMADAPRVDGFEWGLMPVPAVDGGDRYLTTFVESAWIPEEADSKDEAKQFLAWLYSDEAADIMAESNAVQPIKGLAERLTGDAANFYAQYSADGVQALVGAFAATKPVPGVDVKATLYDSANAYLNGDLTAEQWREAVNEASNRLTDQLAG